MYVCIYIYTHSNNLYLSFYCHSKYILIILGDIANNLWMVVVQD
jgi:hypothetical protein